MSAKTAFEVGDRVDLRSAIGVIPKGLYEVIRVLEPNVVIVEIETGKRRTVSIDDLAVFMRPAFKIDWP